MARPGRGEWPMLGGLAQPQADTLSPCYSDLTAYLILPPHYLLSQDHSFAGRAAAYSITTRGLQPPTNNKPGFRKQHLGCGRKGHTSKGNWSVEATAPGTKEQIVFEPDAP